MNAGREELGLILQSFRIVDENRSLAHKCRTVYLKGYFCRKTEKDSGAGLSVQKRPSGVVRNLVSVSLSDTINSMRKYDVPGRSG